MAVTIDDLESIVGPTAVLTGEEVSARSAGVWEKGHVEAKAIVRPTSTEEIASILRACNAAGQPVVVHGGLTNLVHSADARETDVVISMERMNQIEEIDDVGRTMTVQAGVLLQNIQETALLSGLMFPVDLGARGSCQIGGNVSTNAGGNRVIRYGMTRENVLGMEAVLADGTVVSSMNKMIKNNAGYDLKHLFIGTEGTLGVITRLVLRLREASISENTAFVACDSFDKIPAFLKFIDRELGGSLSAFEVMWSSFYNLVTTPPAKTTPPLPQTFPFYILVESLGGDPAADAERFQTAMERAFEQELLADGVIAKSEGERAAMWGMRDDVEQVHNLNPVFTFDVSVGIRHMDAYVEQIRAELKAHWPQHHFIVFGHLGDGNLHFGISVGDKNVRADVERVVYQPLQALGGSVSAEHGIGLEKKPYLNLCRTDGELQLMSTLKRSLDPNGILNPGKIFD